MEVIGHLKKLQVNCVALLETRVKIKNIGPIRKIMGDDWNYIDNYNYHKNGMIWLMWKPNY